MVSASACNDMADTSSFQTKLFIMNEINFDMKFISNDSIFIDDLGKWYG